MALALEQDAEHPRGVGVVIDDKDAERCVGHACPPWCWSLVPVRPARLATAAVSSAGSTGLAMCVWKPASKARFLSSVRANAVRAAAGICLAE